MNPLNIIAQVALVVATGLSITYIIYLITDLVKRK